jgi:hypothetical protein
MLRARYSHNEYDNVSDDGCKSARRRALHWLLALLYGGLNRRAAGLTARANSVQVYQMRFNSAKAETSLCAEQVAEHVHTVTAHQPAHQAAHCQEGQ